jgi:hypothetical protein
MANLKVGWGDVSTDVRGDERRSVEIYSTQRASSIALRSNERRVRVSDGDEGEILLV